MGTLKLDADSLREMKSRTPIPMLTAYTTPVARCLEEAGIPVILVGDTVGVVEMGFDSTRDVTLEHMQYHVGAVRRGAADTHIVADLPYDTDRDPDTALRSAASLRSAGADTVKLEGPKYEVIQRLAENDIDVVGHTGLTPQTASSLRQVGRESPDAERIMDEARGIAEAGAYMVVLEHMPDALAREITRSLAIPTIGIGAGPSCDGQVLVAHDAIGLSERWPPFARQYAHVGQAIADAAAAFRKEVMEGTY